MSHFENANGEVEVWRSRSVYERAKKLNYEWIYAVISHLKIWRKVAHGFINNQLHHNYVSEQINQASSMKKERKKENYNCVLI